MLLLGISVGFIAGCAATLATLFIATLLRPRAALG